MNILQLVIMSLRLLYQLPLVAWQILSHLVGFGLDSIVESLSGLVLIWRLRQHRKITEEEEERVEKKAMKFIAITFLILALYVLFQSIKKLIFREIPDPSLPGIIIAIVSTLVMPILSLQKYRIGKKINSKALIADSKETLACFFLSLALLLGLGLNYLLDFWQADPIVGIIIVVFLLREGIASWKESNEKEKNNLGIPIKQKMDDNK